MKIKVPCNIHNRFDVFVMNIETGEEKQVAYAENIILNQLWTFPWGSHGYSGNVGRLHLLKDITVGDGSGDLSASRTSLFHEVFTARAGSLSYTVNEEGNYVIGRGSVTRTETQDVNVEYSEIGLRAMHDPIYGNTSLVTHAILRDMNGNITTIVKKETEIITFYASLYLYVPQRNFHGNSIYLDSLNHSVFSAIINGTAGGVSKTFSFIHGFYTTTAVTVKTTQHYSQAASLAWNAAAKRLKFSLRVPVESGNGLASYGCYGFWQIRHSSLVLQLPIPHSKEVQGIPWYPVSDILAETLGIGDGVKRYFKTKYPFPTDIVIKINGTIVPPGNYTVNQDYIPSPYMDNLFLRDSVGFYNPYHETFGIKQVYMYNNSVSASQDGETWVVVGSGDGTKTVNAAYRNYKYWRCNVASGNAVYAYNYLLDGPTDEDFTNIHFNIAPDEDDIITIDYVTPAIPKDSNHVFDLAIEYFFGEYIPE